MLKTNLCGKTLKSPLILGSGTLGEKKELLIKSLEYGAGAVVPRTLRINPSGRELYSPAYYMEDNFMLNADNQNTTPWTYWVESARDIERYGSLIVSISARNPDDCKTIVSAFENEFSPSFYEINFSCPHSASIYGDISYENARDALRITKEITNKPVFLKLSLRNIDYKEIKKIEEENLIDAFVLSNSIGPGLKIDIEKRKPVLGSILGGMSGAAIKPLVLGEIYNFFQKTKKPIIGAGGIESAEDALEYIILGCSAVQIYTAAHKRGVNVFEEINRGLENFLKKKGENIENIKGSLTLK